MKKKIKIEFNFIKPKKPDALFGEVFELQDYRDYIFGYKAIIMKDYSKVLILSFNGLLFHLRVILH
jgi:hypothetical protein